MKPLILGLVLGVTTGIAGIHLYDWQFWVITIPCLIVASWPARHTDY